MRFRAHFLMLCCLMPLAGCAVATTLNSLTATPDLSGNWTIASTSGPAVPTAGLLLVGSLTSQGSNVSGIFRLANLALPNSCGVPLQQVVAVTGTIDSSRNLKLTSAAFSGSVLTIQMVVPPTINPVGGGVTPNSMSGTIAIAGGACTFGSSPAFGYEVVSLTGTFDGPITAALTNAPIPAGNVSLVLSQSTTPQSDGQYPVIGTLNFTGGGCTSSTSFSGTVSGSLLTLASAPTGAVLPSIDNLVALVNPVTGQLDLASLIFPTGPCGTSLLSFSQFTGNLTRQ